MLSPGSLSAVVVWITGLEEPVSALYLGQDLDKRFRWRMGMMNGEGLWWN